MYTCLELVTQLTFPSISNGNIQGSNSPPKPSKYIYVGSSFCHELSGKVYYGVNINLSEFIIYYISKVDYVELVSHRIKLPIQSAEGVLLVN